MHYNDIIAPHLKAIYRVLLIPSRNLFMEKILLFDINLQHKVGILQFVMIF